MIEGLNRQRRVSDELPSIEEQKKEAKKILEEQKEKTNKEVDTEQESSTLKN